MLNNLSGLKLWHYAFGGGLLFIWSLHGLYSAIDEQWDRSDVLAHGANAQSRVVRANGLESVQIEWTDEGGMQRTAESKTGRPFARTSLGTTVPIKYDRTLVREPVILSEVGERERIDAYSLRSSLLVVAVWAAVVFTMWRLRLRRAGEATK